MGTRKNNGGINLCSPKLIKAREGRVKLIIWEIRIIYLLPRRWLMFPQKRPPIKEPMIWM
jgi:hypothetical protein